jgi:hypothetical protein
MYYGYSDIFSSVPAKYFIRKPIDNEELLKRISEIVIDDTGFEANDMRVLTK